MFTKPAEAINVDDSFMRTCAVCWLGLLLILVEGCKPKLSGNLKSDLSNAVHFVESYGINNARFPEREEFHAWLWTNYSAVADYELVHSGKGPASYRIHVWIGERMLIYSSETKSLKEDH
jgi:hypothetical protein